MPSTERATRTRGRDVQQCPERVGRFIAEARFVTRQVKHKSPDAVIGHYRLKGDKEVRAEFTLLERVKGWGYLVGLEMSANKP